MFAAPVVIEPLTYEMALALGHGLASHCFTFGENGSDTFIRPEFTQVQVRPHEREQAMTLRMALDTTPHCLLRQVRLPLLTVTKRGEDNEAPTLRLTMSLLLDTDKVAMEFFAGFIGASFFVSFEPEQVDLFSSAALVEDDARKSDGLLPPEDAEAGDVLDEQAAADVATPRTPKPKRGAKPRLVKGGPTPAPGSDSVQ